MCIRDSSKTEHQLPPEQYYNEQEAAKYSNNPHIIEIQTQLTERALAILALPPEKKALILDIGCGSGISGCVLTDNGYEWVGVDMSKWMLNVCLLYTSPSPRDLSTYRMPSSA
eukprot:TRINITY_DN19829_c0_g1_i1.p1 TRINITY_DN19829_c0_g1~~TRINITY_DN19829_c0_g1_i1.p1  ORF type:complete len:113 (+),score=56.49 TRINITY_DN19829_c0_g1_i1:56-394(+)